MRASSASGPSNWMEGIVTYSGTTLTMTSDKTNGSGTKTDWNLNVVGEPGAGDLSSANNLSDVASAATARANLGIPALLRGHIAGLTLSAAGSTGTFGIAAGVATDSTNVDVMALASAYTKTTSAWAVGSGNGAMDTGSVANNTWYHVHLIKRPVTGVVDVLFSLSAAAPTLPTSYTIFRRIGSMRTDGSAQWRKFYQVGDTFHSTDTVVADVSAAATTAARVSTTLTVPTGIVVEAKFHAALNAVATCGTFFKCLLDTDISLVSHDESICRQRADSAAGAIANSPTRRPKSAFVPARPARNFGLAPTAGSIRAGGCHNDHAETKASVGQTEPLGDPGGPSVLLDEQFDELGQADVEFSRWRWTGREEWGGLGAKERCATSLRPAGGRIGTP